MLSSSLLSPYTPQTVFECLTSHPEVSCHYKQATLPLLLARGVSYSKQPNCIITNTNSTASNCKLNKESEFGRHGCQSVEQLCSNTEYNRHLCSSNCTTNQERRRFRHWSGHPLPVCVCTFSSFGTLGFDPLGFCIMREQTSIANQSPDYYCSPARFAAAMEAQ